MTSISEDIRLLEQAAQDSTKLQIMITYKKTVARWRLTLNLHERGAWLEHRDFGELISMGVKMLRKRRSSGTIIEWERRVVLSPKLEDRSDNDQK